MRMTPEAFHTWSQHLGLNPETEAIIASIRSSRPVRRVSGRAGNIIQPEGNRVKFSWHPKRTTTTPNHGKRWVRRGSIWELAD